MKLLIVTFTVVFALCSSPAQARILVFACEPEWAALAKELGGDLVETHTATTGLQDPHYIQARPSLIAAVRVADMIACTGADLEAGWLPLLLQRAANRNVQVGGPGYFMATRYVRMRGIPQQLNRSRGEVHAAGNPHVQTSPGNILPIAKAMADRLMQLDAENSEAYQHRLDSFEIRWRAALARWKEVTRPLRGTPIVVHHDNWIYLEHWLNLRRVAVLEDKPGIPPTSGYLSKVLNTLKETPAKVIVRAAYQNEKPSQWLAKKTNVPVVTLPLTVGGSAAATDLFSLYDDTFQRLLRAVSP